IPVPQHAAIPHFRTDDVTQLLQENGSLGISSAAIRHIRMKMIRMGGQRLYHSGCCQSYIGLVGSAMRETLWLFSKNGIHGQGGRVTGKAFVHPMIEALVIAQDTVKPAMYQLMHHHTY